MKNYFAILFTTLLFSCSSTQRIGSDKLASDEANLNQEEAQYRAKLLKDLHYDLSFQLEQDKSYYAGKADIGLHWRGSSSDTLWLDFNGGTVLELKVNNKSADFRRTKSRILIPGSAFDSGKNRIFVSFKQDYSSNGSGFYRFTDPQDKAVYTYTTLEPFDANRVFPAFDQPDLKATYEMTIAAPSSWQVITYAAETSIEKSAGQYLWKFPKSLPISTYIWSIHAGPYRMWKDEQSRIPSRLFARKSLAKYVVPEDWFTITRQGFDFFESYFDEPYPFQKYDQIIVPDFKAGAMENVAAVSFSERLVSRGDELHSKKRDRADIILHEMAHMWFGNLTTMRWWNDLWLNESFATYMATLAMSKVTEFSGDEAWREFFNTKTWGYTTDLEVTTHPIEAPTTSTNDAFTSFDGITYAKGAAMMKQLDFLLGAAGFQKGVQTYFNRHRFANATLADFMSALEEGSGRDLTRWTKEWLKTKGLNSITIEKDCSGNKLKTLHISQEIANGDTLYRSQKTRLGLFALESKFLKQTGTLDVEYSGKKGSHQVVENHVCPAFIYANMDDHAYLLPRYTDKDLTLINEHYSRIESPFLRQQLIFDLWQSLRRGEIKLSSFADLLYQAIGLERDPSSLEGLLWYLRNRYGAPSLYHYTDFEAGESLERFEDLVWELFRKTDSKFEEKKIYLDYYLRIARSKNHLENLSGLLEGRSKKRGEILDPDQRWSAIKALAEAGDSRATTFADRELARDSSHFGHLSKLAVQSLQPDEGMKNQLFLEVVKNEPPRTAEQIITITANLFPENQRKLSAPFQGRFFETLAKMHKTLEPERMDAYLELIPDECFYGKAGKISEFLKTTRGLSPQVEKALKIADQYNSICRKVRQQNRKEAP